MIAFGSSINDPEAYRRYARPGIERVREPDSEVWAFAAAGPVGRSYNLLLDTAAPRDDLEALVLVHQSAEIAGEGFCDTVREALRDPRVGALGSAGSRGASTIAWWDGELHAAQSTRRYHDHGGGELPAFPWAESLPVPADVDTLDGLLLVLSPWAVRNLRFDEALQLGHGFDFDYCNQLRASGRRVIAADLRLIHHGPLKLVDNFDVWIEGHMRVADKWDGNVPGASPAEADWKRRARRAEAERDAARTIAYSSKSRLDAETLPLERELAELEASISWRLTRPLRELNSWRRRRAG